MIPDGWKLVPVEPTEKMLDDAEAGSVTLETLTDVINNETLTYWRALAKYHWTKMLAASPPSPVGEEMWRTGWNDAIDAMTTDRKIIWPYTNKTFGASNGSNEFTDAYWKGVEDYRSALIALKRQSGEG